MGDTDLELVARLAVGIIEQLNPEVRGKSAICVETSYRVRARHVTSFVHILFFLLDNAVRHSNVSKQNFHSQISITTAGDDLTLSVANNMPSSECALSASKKIIANVGELKKKLDPETVIREGGSGYAKIIAAVRFGFAQDDPLIDVVVVEENTLCVSLTCKIKGIIA
jgi:hypothetical protein